MYIRASITNILDEPYDFQYMQAYDHSTDPRILAELAKSPYTDIREGVAHNPCTPENVLRMLVKDAHIGVRNNARSNAKAPRDFKDINSDEWYYSSKFEFGIKFYYPDDAGDLDACNRIIMRSVEDFVNEYGNFTYESGRIYTQPDKDYATFLFTCEYIDDDTNRYEGPDIWADWLNDDLKHFIDDLEGPTGELFYVYDVYHVRLLGN